MARIEKELLRRAEAKEASKGKADGLPKKLAWVLPKKVDEDRSALLGAKTSLDVCLELLPPLSSKRDGDGIAAHLAASTLLDGGSTQFANLQGALTRFAEGRDLGTGTTAVGTNGSSERSREEPLSDFIIESRSKPGYVEFKVAGTGSGSASPKMALSVEEGKYQDLVGGGGRSFSLEMMMMMMIRYPQTGKKVVVWGTGFRWNVWGSGRLCHHDGLPKPKPAALRYGAPWQSTYSSELAML